MKKEEKNIKKENTEALSKTNVMPRFFVDERVGCIAIRDTQHPEFDVEHQGLDADMPCVVKFQMGNLAKNGWELRDDTIQRFKDECASLNGA